MRLFKLILTAVFAVFAVVAGLFIAVVAASISAVLFLLGRTRNVRPSGRNVPSFRPAETRATKPGDLDVIDVTATEIPADERSR